MTPQNYYARRTVWCRQRVDLGLLLELVRVERRYQPRLGGRKLYHLIAPELRAAGVKLGRDRFFEELGRAGLLVERKRAPWPRTTRFDANLPVFKNLIKRRKVDGPNQVWVADITYIRTREMFLYLSLLTDQWSRKIVGYHLGETLAAQHTLQALAMALKGLKDSVGLIHHSDRGCQYASHEYVQAARQAKIRMSMTEQNHCGENALAERMNGILKQEYGLDETFDGNPEARRATREGVHLYNTRRPHTCLGLQTPEEAHGHGSKN